MADSEVTIFQRRRIEAEIIRSVHRVLTRHHGREAADRLIGEAVVEDAEAAGRSAAEGLGRSGLAAFASILPNWSKGGAQEMEILASSDEVLDYDVTRCRYAEMYREIGMEDLGHLLSCGRDGAFMRGFDPRVEMCRTGTIMTGAARCDFRFRAKKA